VLPFLSSVEQTLKLIYLYKRTELAQEGRKVPPVKQRSLELEGNAEDSDDDVSQSEVADVQVDDGVHSPSRR
jgi:hypothetical protein